MSVACAARLRQGVEGREVGGVERHLRRRNVLFEALQLARARDRDDRPTLRERPRQGDLGGRAAVLLRYRAHCLDEGEVRLQRRLVAKARVLTAPIANLEVGELREATGEKAA